MKYVEKVLCARGPGPHQQPVVDLLQKFFAERSRQESLDWLAALDVCSARVNTLLEARADPNVAARSLLLHDKQGRPHLAPLDTICREHTEEVLTELEAETGEW